MFLSNFSVKKPIATIVLILAMMCMGLLALSKLRVNQNPDVEIPVIVVSIPYPGASPETSEREIINRLEKQMLSDAGRDRGRVVPRTKAAPSSGAASSTSNAT
jgi:multidrug efflux pump subunit AcrB